jgi:3-hydroxyacyl-[acyl-carrier-protein] dehydratase
LRLSSPEGTLFHSDPAAYIPHRPPFLFIDRVTALEAGVEASGEIALTGGAFPSILLVEAMAQLGGIAAGQQQGTGGVLAALTRVRLPPRLNPEGKFAVVARVVKNFGRLILVEGEVREQGETIACATLTLAIGEP